MFSSEKYIKKNNQANILGHSRQNKKKTKNKQIILKLLNRINPL